MVTIDDDVDTFVTTDHGEKYGWALAQRISIPVGVLMHLKVLHFKLDDRNKCDSLPDAAMLAAIDKAQIFFIRSTSN